MEVVEKRRKTTLPFFRFNFFLKHTQSPLSTPNVLYSCSLTSSSFPHDGYWRKLHSLPPCVHTSMATPESLTTHFCPLWPWNIPLVVTIENQVSRSSFSPTSLQTFILMTTIIWIPLSTHHLFLPFCSLYCSAWVPCPCLLLVDQGRWL